MTRKVKDPIATHNERIKLFAGLISTIAYAIIVAAFADKLKDSTKSVNGLLFVLGLMLWWISPAMMRFLRKEGKPE